MTLLAGDLRHLVDNIFEIDSFASKMGDDKNIVTLSFSVKDKQPAEDLANFLEKGYSFILDADVTSGEQSDGTYKVFVEIARDKGVHDNINEIVDGVKKITGIEDLKFRYYKNFKSMDATPENLLSEVPDDPDRYGITTNENKLRNFKNFFSNSYLESVDMDDDILTIKKKYADELRFKYIAFGDSDVMNACITETFDVNGFAEILFLTKYLGEYHISKYGDKLVFENQGKSLILKRI